MSLSPILLTCFCTVLGLILQSDARTTPVPNFGQTRIYGNRFPAQVTRAPRYQSRNRATPVTRAPNYPDPMRWSQKPKYGGSANSQAIGGNNLAAYTRTPNYQPMRWTQEPNYGGNNFPAAYTRAPKYQPMRWTQEPNYGGNNFPAAYTRAPNYNPMGFTQYPNYYGNVNVRHATGAPNYQDSMGWTEDPYVRSATVRVIGGYNDRLNYDRLHATDAPYNRNYMGWTQEPNYRGGANSRVIGGDFYATSRIPNYQDSMRWGWTEEPNYGGNNFPTYTRAPNYRNAMAWSQAPNYGGVSFDPYYPQPATSAPNGGNQYQNGVSRAPIYQPDSQSRAPYRRRRRGTQGPN